MAPFWKKIPFLEHTLEVTTICGGQNQYSNTFNRIKLNVVKLLWKILYFEIFCGLFRDNFSFSVEAIEIFYGLATPII